VVRCLARGRTADQALRDPAHPTRMLPIYDCGDHLHPSDQGYNAMGDAIDLALYGRRPGAARRS